MVKKRPLRNLKEFLQGIPKMADYFDLAVTSETECPDDCCEMKVVFRREAFEAKRQAYFKHYPFWYWLAKLLRRKEVR